MTTKKYVNLTKAEEPFVPLWLRTKYEMGIIGDKELQSYMSQGMGEYSAFVKDRNDTARLVNDTKANGQPQTEAAAPPVDYSAAFKDKSLPELVQNSLALSESMIELNDNMASYYDDYDSAGEEQKSLFKKSEVLPPDASTKPVNLTQEMQRKQMAGQLTTRASTQLDWGKKRLAELEQQAAALDAEIKKHGTAGSLAVADATKSWRSIAAQGLSWGGAALGGLAGAIPYFSVPSAGGSVVAGATAGKVIGATAGAALSAEPVYNAAKVEARNFGLSKEEAEDYAKWMTTAEFGTEFAASLVPGAGAVLRAPIKNRVARWAMETGKDGVLRQVAEENIAAGATLATQVKMGEGDGKLAEFARQQTDSRFANIGEEFERTTLSSALMGGGLKGITGAVDQAAQNKEVSARAEKAKAIFQEQLASPELKGNFNALEVARQRTAAQFGLNPDEVFKAGDLANLQKNVEADKQAKTLAIDKALNEVKMTGVEAFDLGQMSAVQSATAPQVSDSGGLFSATNVAQTPVDPKWNEQFTQKLDLGLKEVENTERQQLEEKLKYYEDKAKEGRLSADDVTKIKNEDRALRNQVANLEKKRGIVSADPAMTPKNIEGQITSFSARRESIRLALEQNRVAQNALNNKKVIEEKLSKQPPVPVKQRINLTQNLNKMYSDSNQKAAEMAEDTGLAETVVPEKAPVVTSTATTNLTKTGKGEAAYTQLFNDIKQASDPQRFDEKAARKRAEEAVSIAETELFSEDKFRGADKTTQTSMLTERASQILNDTKIGERKKAADKAKSEVLAKQTKNQELVKNRVKKQDEAAKELAKAYGQEAADSLIGSGRVVIMSDTSAFGDEASKSGGIFFDGETIIINPEMIKNKTTIAKEILTKEGGKEKLTAAEAKQARQQFQTRTGRTISEEADLTASTVRAVGVHEFGHEAKDSLESEPLLSKVTGDKYQAAIEAIKKEALGNSPLAKRAVERANKASPNDTAIRDEEIVTYYLEELEKGYVGRTGDARRAVNQMTSKVREMMVKAGVPIKNIRPKDLLYLSYKTADRIAKNPTVTKTDSDAKFSIGYAGARGFGAALREGRAFKDPVTGMVAFDIPDDGMELDVEKLRDMGEAKLADVVRHPKLFENWPFLKDINISFTGIFNDQQAGGYHTGTKTILLNEKIKNVDLMHSVILHEATHAIQERLGISSGSDVAYAEDLTMKALLAGTKINIEDVRTLAKMRDTPTWKHFDALFKNIYDTRKQMEAEGMAWPADKLIRDLDNIKQSPNFVKQFKALQPLTTRLASLQDTKNAYMAYEAILKADEGKFWTYMQNPGEIVARAVQHVYSGEFSGLEAALTVMSKQGPGTLDTPKKVRGFAMRMAEQTGGRSSPRFSKGYHGTPHTVDKFRMDRMGTGEGAQAYGWGMYFTAKKEIADHYRKTLSLNRGQFALVDKQTGTQLADDVAGAALVNDRLKSYGADLRATDIPRFKEIWRDNIKRYEQRSEEAEPLRDKYKGDSEMLSIIDQQVSDYAKNIADTKAAIALIDKVERKALGQIYVVEVPEDYDLLDWDKPLSEQPDKVRAAIAAIDIDRPIRNKSGQSILEMDPYGQELYKMLGSPETASRILNDAGIPGLRYLDGTSRGAGEGSHNYVIWDENAISTPEAVRFSKGYDSEDTDTAKYDNPTEVKRGIGRGFLRRNVIDRMAEGQIKWVAEAADETADSVYRTLISDKVPDERVRILLEAKRASSQVAMARMNDIAQRVQKASKNSDLGVTGVDEEWASMNNEKRSANTGNEELDDALNSARTLVDEMSLELVRLHDEAGVPIPKGTRGKIIKEIGTYLTRTYEINYNKQWGKNLLRAARSGNEKAKKTIDDLDEFIENDIVNRINNVAELGKKDVEMLHKQIFGDKKGSTKAQIEAIQNFAKDRDVPTLVKEIRSELLRLSKNTKFMEFYQGASRNTGILEHRVKIHPALMAAWGLREGMQETAIHTVIKQARLLGETQFQVDMLKRLPDKFGKTADDQLTSLIPEGKEYGILAGMYTTPEMLEFIQAQAKIAGDFDAILFDPTSSRAQEALAAGIVQYISRGWVWLARIPNTFVRWNPKNYILNLLGAFQTGFGLIPSIVGNTKALTYITEEGTEVPFSEWFTATLREVATGKLPEGPAAKVWEAILNSGIHGAGTSIDIETEYKNNVQRAVAMGAQAQYDTRTGRAYKRATGLLGEHWQLLQHGTNVMFNAPELMVTSMNYVIETNAVREQWDAEGKAYSQRELEMEAADRTKKSVINRDRAFNLAKTLDRFGFTSFLTFFTESMRAPLNRFRLGLMEVWEADKLESPEAQAVARKHGWLQMASASSMMAAAYASTRFIGSMLGYAFGSEEDEVEEALSEEMRANKEHFVVIGKSKDGNKLLWDTSQLNTYSMLINPLEQAVQGNYENAFKLTTDAAFMNPLTAELATALAEWQSNEKIAPDRTAIGRWLGNKAAELSQASGLPDYLVPDYETINRVANVAARLNPPPIKIGAGVVTDDFKASREDAATAYYMSLLGVNPIEYNISKSVQYNVPVEIRKVSEAYQELNQALKRESSTPALIREQMLNVELAQHKMVQTIGPMIRAAVDSGRISKSEVIQAGFVNKGVSLPPGAQRAMLYSIYTGKPFVPPPPGPGLLSLSEELVTMGMENEESKQKIRDTYRRNKEILQQLYNEQRGIK